jgi:hypothetical protein
LRERQERIAGKGNGTAVDEDEVVGGYQAATPDEYQNE